MVLPWNALTVEIKADFFVYILASLIAHSLASVPLAQKKEYLISPGVISARSRASTPRSGSMSSCEGIGLCRSCACTTEMISGCDHPCEKSPYPPSQSMYSRHMTSANTAPCHSHSVAAHIPHCVTDLRFSSHHLLKCSAKLWRDSEMIHSDFCLFGCFRLLMISIQVLA